MRRHAQSALALMALSPVMLCGCASSSRVDQPEALNPHLVMPGIAEFEIEQPQVGVYDEVALADMSRNDDRLGAVTWAPGIFSVEFVRVRHREYLRTSNGDPREYSSTYTQAVRQTVVR